MSRKTFIDLYSSGEVSLEEIDDFIDEWHKSVQEMELHEFLGMSQKEYINWIERGELDG